MANEDTLWLVYEKSGHESGPFTVTELKNHYAAGRISEDASVSPKGFFGPSEWKLFRDYFPDFKGEAKRPVKPVEVSNVPRVAPLSSLSSLPSTTDAVQKRSGWATLFRVLGGGLILIGIVGVSLYVAASNDKERESAFILIILGIAGAIQCFFFSFLVDVFTDIRWFLKKIADKG